ncbi:glutathione peroxidase [Oecophyllibacter saccharovorans]|uniref:Glutathione peroxidase n=1 Tax=Oecophyllibacter saccharovorans TaxID=2558360 RepID=A0A506UQ10_9PROT|nr:glutathione peroxidase [Oecophyllibacter saccharovorans]TPW35481.1 glutathione peroxidase [Oecophyllibacter saccharovorans]
MASSSAPSSAQKPTAYDFTLPALSGSSAAGPSGTRQEEKIDLSRWRGRPLLIVNTASRCGFTPQYEALEALWQSQAKDSDGLVVIGVPSNDFGAQELDTPGEIASFCQARYSVTFPLAARSHVRGPQAVPLYRWLAGQAGFLGRPRWNFHKYLIGRDGRLQDWFLPSTTPSAPRLQRAIRRALQPPPPARAR